MEKRRKSGSRGPEPDDYFASGPLEMARFGKTMIMRSRLTPSGHRAMQAHMAEMLPEVVSNIDAIVQRIVTRVACVPADRLLHRAYWEFAALAITKGAAAVEEAGALRMIDYVQSIVASTPPAAAQHSDVSEDDWEKLKTDIHDLFGRITIRYQSCLTASRLAIDPDLDMALEEFRFRAEGMWMHVRGKRYQPHETIALAELLEPHSDVLLRLFGIDAPTLVTELGKILAKLTGGVGDLMLAMKKLHEDSIARMDVIAGLPGIDSKNAFVTKLWEDPDLAARRDVIAGELVGLGSVDKGDSQTA